MGRPPNISGKPIKCQHCGYTWLTHSTAEYVPCPRCLYRVRNYKKSAVEKSPELVSERKTDLI